MKIPKKIDTLLKRRTKLAEDLMAVCYELDDWLEDKGANLSDSQLNDGVLTGAMIYCEPMSAETLVREYIENYM